MIPFLDASKPSFKLALSEFDEPIAELFTPLTRYRPKQPTNIYGIDSGAYAGFKEKPFRSLLVRELPRKHLCQFVAVPDVVGNAHETRKWFDAWYMELAQWPLAYVLQDGQATVPIPWEHIRSIFIGGSTEFKMSEEAVSYIKAAQERGLWVHVGRVNSPDRWVWFEAAEADSADGTGISRYSHMRIAVSNRHRTHQKEKELYHVRISKILPSTGA